MQSLMKQRALKDAIENDPNLTLKRRMQLRRRWMLKLLKAKNAVNCRYKQR